MPALKGQEKLLILIDWLIRWYIDVSRETAKARLVERHLRTGIETCPLAAAARAEGNDLRNADYIASRLSEPDVVIRSC